MRIALFVILALLVFAAFNFVAIRCLLRIHPRRRRMITAVALAGNAFWPVIPLLGQLNPFTRLARSAIGPLWFSWQSLAILYTALMAIVAIAWMVVRHRVNFAAFARWPSRAFWILVLIGGVVGFYQALVPIRIERVPVELDGLPRQADRMRIVLLADLHVGLFTRQSRLDTIFATARALEPDAVLILGDLIDDDPHFVPRLLAGTRALGTSIPLLAALGNHEIYGDPDRVVRELEGSRIELLVNEGRSLRGVWLAGIGEPASQQAFRRRYDHLKPDIDAALRRRPPYSFPILFSHQPRIFYEARKRRLPLTLSAHTHGGQCGIRPLGWSLAGVFLEYHMGLYRWGASQLYINTGTGFWVVPFRLGMTPEITLIELRRRPR